MYSSSNYLLKNRKENLEYSKANPLSFVKTAKRAIVSYVIILYNVNYAKLVP